MIWKTEYSTVQDNICVDGYSISKDDCCDYFSDRVSTIITGADGAEQLREYLIDLQTTGFDSDALRIQTEESPLLKDWEIGESIAEAVLEDEHDVMFPWATAWDKRTPHASLPGADIVGFQNKASPRFIFGQVKSSSEMRTPPQIVSSGSDCLEKQMYNLRHRKSEQQQLIQWLLMRVKGTSWEDTFRESIQKYTNDDYCLVGLLISGGRNADAKDLTEICAGIKHVAASGEVALFGYYLPYDKNKWVSLFQERGATS